VNSTESIGTRFIGIRQKALSAEHPDTAVSLYNLGDKVTHTSNARIGRMPNKGLPILQLTNAEQETMRLRQLWQRAGARICKTMSDLANGLERRQRRAAAGTEIRSLRCGGSDPN
jgi:hypothetical protein